MADSPEKMIEDSLKQQILDARSKREDWARKEQAERDAKADYNKTLDEARRYHTALVALKPSTPVFPTFKESVERTNPS